MSGVAIYMGGGWGDRQTIQDQIKESVYLRIVGGVSGGGGCGGGGGRERRRTTGRDYPRRKRDEPGGNRRSWISRSGDIGRDDTGHRDADH